MFSELVDEVMAETKRAVDKPQIMSFVNATIRECQTVNGVLFEKDMIEDIATTGSANPYLWTRPARFRKMQAVQYSASTAFPKFVMPGVKITEQGCYWYAASNYMAFFGAGSLAEIRLAYFIYSRRLSYYDAGSRPAVFDRETEQWSYAAEYVTDDEKALARDLSAHWLLESWYDCIKEGTVAKILKRANDQNTNQSFAAYKSFQALLLQGEFKLNVGTSA